MKIVKYGNIPTPNNFRFECDYCGCVWECEENEVKSSYQYNERWIYCKCPTCDRSNNPLPVGK